MQTIWGKRNALLWYWTHILICCMHVPNELRFSCNLCTRQLPALLFLLMTEDENIQILWQTANGCLNRLGARQTFCTSYLDAGSSHLGKPKIYLPTYLPTYLRADMPNVRLILVYFLPKLTYGTANWIIYQLVATKLPSSTEQLLLTATSSSTCKG